MGAQQRLWALIIRTKQDRGAPGWWRIPDFGTQKDLGKYLPRSLTFWVLA